MSINKFTRVCIFAIIKHSILQCSSTTKLDSSSYVGLVALFKSIYEACCYFSSNFIHFHVKYIKVIRKQFVNS